MAATGAEALEKLSAVRYDLLLLDLGVVSPSGIELLEMLHADPRYDDLPIVMTSSISQSDTVQRAIALGVADYLLKPFQQPMVEERLRRALAEARRASRDLQRHGSVCLVAHRDQAFCETLAEALSPDRRVIAAHTLAAFIQQANGPKPEVVLFDPDLLGSRLNFLATSLSRRYDPPPRLISVGPLDGEEPVGYIGAIQKTFSPGPLAESITHLLDNLPLALPGMEEYREDLISVVRQAFGVMTGDEATPLPDDLDWSAPSVSQIDLRQDHEIVWRLTLQADREMARRLVAELAGLEESEIEEEFELSGMQEIANIVGGRLHRIATAAGVQLEGGLPELPTGPPPPNSIRTLFRWRQHSPFAALLGSCRSIAAKPSAAVQPSDQVSQLSGR